MTVNSPNGSTQAEAPHHARSLPQGGLAASAHDAQAGRTPPQSPLDRLRLISTDFDGTFFSEFENPPVPPELEALIAELQAEGVLWAINTGRDLSSLMESLGRAHLRVRPDFLVLVERHIYVREGPAYQELESWNQACNHAHRQVFDQVRPHLQQLQSWITERFRATVYHDDFSPLCLIADNNNDCDVIYEYLQAYAQTVPQLAIVRNDVYARLSHCDYHKGSALGEIARQLGIKAAQTLAAGDHFNDLSMLDPQYAHSLVAPANAIPEVKALIRHHQGFISEQPAGLGTADGIRHFTRHDTPAKSNSR